MGIGTNPDTGQAFAAALDWWREAGVDYAFLDEAQSWLPPVDEAGGPAQNRHGPPRKEPEAAPVEPAPLSIPESLNAFQSWWMSAPELDAGRCTGRVAPRGTAGAQLMILALPPEANDRDVLLSGAEGRLLDAFLSVAGINDEAVYRASVLPCHSPGADWSPAANGVVAEALVRHVELVRPERLLVLGYVLLPLLGHGSPQGPAVSTTFNHQGRTIPMLAVRRIPAVASQPRWKSALWRAWLDWNG